MVTKYIYFNKKKKKRKEKPPQNNSQCFKNVHVKRDGKYFQRKRRIEHRVLFNVFFKCCNVFNVLMFLML